MADYTDNITSAAGSYHYVSLPKVAADWGLDLNALPFSLKVLLENIVRNQPDQHRRTRKIFTDWQKERTSTAEIFYQPVRVLMQDFTGVPAVVDLAAMRDFVAAEGGDPQKITPLSPVDLVIDHSVSVDHYGNADAFARNMELEFARNLERYELLKWAQASFANFRVVPPGTGICHQVNLEYLAQVVWQDQEQGYLYPDTLVGTDSHTTMINALGVLGWGVGGIEAEAAMLKQPISMVLPEVCGVKISGCLTEGVTATDLVLKIVETLRRKGVVGKFVEYWGDGIDNLTLAERATISNMAPEYGATCGFFPIDDETLRYLQLVGKSAQHIELITRYAQQQGLWREQGPAPAYTEVVEIDLNSIVPSVAGPKRPQDLIPLPEIKRAFKSQLSSVFGVSPTSNSDVAVARTIDHGATVICAITSCTNTSNPRVMIRAGLLARKALAKGLSTQKWVKTSLAPGSQVVSEYLQDSGLQSELDCLGFHNVGYGCTTCIGNSGALDKEISDAIVAFNLVTCSVLSGNRNFEGRINQEVKANYLASPPLVVAYALVGRIDIDLTSEPLGHDQQGSPVYLRDIWPSDQEVATVLAQVLQPQLFAKRYRSVFSGSKEWQGIKAGQGDCFQWRKDSTYIRKPAFFSNLSSTPSPIADISGARLLARLGDSVTTDHISPAGAIKADSPAGHYLRDCGIAPVDFNSYGARRGNHEVMVRGTFANIRIKNLLLDGVEGGFTRYAPTGEQMSIFAAANLYRQSNTPLIVIAGKNYGSGSSRDWAAKGTLLLGVKVVICESIERIHRSNLIGMGVLPLEDFSHRLASIQLNGDELFNFKNLATSLQPEGTVNCEIVFPDRTAQEIPLRCRIDTRNELEYFRNGGILPCVLRQIMKEKEAG